MKTKHIISGLAMLVLITLTLSNCTKDSGTRSGSGMNLKLKAANTAYNIPVQNGGPISVIPTLPFVSWDVATMNVSRVRFEAEMLSGDQTGDPHEVEFSWVGPKTVDLFDLSATLGNIPVPPGDYKEIEFTIYGYKSDAVNRPVFYLSGTYTNAGGKQIPLIIDVSDDVIIKVEQESGPIIINNATSVSGIIQLYLEKLFSSILPKDIELSTMSDGKIIISATSNTDLYKIILENFHKNNEGAFVRE